MTSNVIAGNTTQGTTTTNQSPPVAAGTPTPVASSNALAAVPSTPAPTTGTLVGKTQEASQTGAKGGESKAPETPQGSPEKYALNSPNESAAFGMGVMQQFEGIARELNLSNESAQKVINSLVPALEAQQSSYFTETLTAWREATMKDSELSGGDEAKLQVNLQLAEKAIDVFGDDSLRTLLVQTGMGNRAEIIRFFAHVGKTVSDDSVSKGSSPNMRDTRDPLEKLADTYR